VHNGDELHGCDSQTFPVVQRLFRIAGKTSALDSAATIQTASTVSG
jgi:hypothetical protein